MKPTYIHSPTLPWSNLAGEERRFRWITFITLVLAIILGLIVPLIDVPEIDKVKKRKLPPRLAQVILERQQQVKPPPKPEIEVPEKKEEKKPEPKKEEKKKEEEKVAKKEPEKPKKKIAEKKVEKDPAAAARKKAASSGILAFADELADLRDAPAITSIKKSKKLSKAGNKAATTQRSLVTASATKGSSGINTSKLSRDTGGTGLSGRKTTKVASAIAGNGGGGSAGAQARDYKLGRSSEEIQLVFDKNKGAVYALYNRALRKNPTLRGKVVLEITIAPNGKVTACKILSSELRDKKLERKLVARIKLFNFGAKKDVDTTVVSYPIDFLPS